MISHNRISISRCILRSRPAVSCHAVKAPQVRSCALQHSCESPLPQPQPNYIPARVLNNTCTYRQTLKQQCCTQSRMWLAEARTGCQWHSSKNWRKQLPSLNSLDKGLTTPQQGQTCWMGDGSCCILAPRGPPPQYSGRSQALRHSPSSKRSCSGTEPPVESTM